VNAVWTETNSCDGRMPHTCQAIDVFEKVVGNMIRSCVYLLVSLLNLILRGLRLDIEGVVELCLLDHGGLWSMLCSLGLRYGSMC
jgi:hypothetical protein